MIYVNTKKYFLRYFIAFTIPIFCMGVLFFYNNISITHKDSATYNLALLRQFANDFDSLLMKTQNTALHMSSNSLILEFDSEFDMLDKSYATDLLKLLRSYEDNISEDITIALYPRSSNIIYVKNEIIPYYDFEKSKEYDLALSISGLFAKLNNITSEFSLEIRNPFDKETKYATSIMYPIPTISARPTSTVCFMIRKEILTRMTEKFFGNMPLNVYVINTNLQNIYASDISKMSDVISAIKKNHLGISEYKFGSSNQILMRTISENTGYQYIIIMDKGIFYSKGQNMLNWLIVLIIVLIIFSAVMAVWLAKNHYTSVARVETKNQEIASELNNQHLIVIEMVLRRILNGSLRNSKVLAYNLNCANIIFDKKYYTVFTFIFDNSFVNEDKYDELVSYIKSMNTDIISFYPVKVQEENQVAVIVNFEACEEQKQTVIEEFNNYISGYQLEYYEIGCGGTYESPINISNAYVESIVAVKEKIKKQKGNCYIFENAPKTEEGFSYPYIEEAVILQSIKNGNADIALTSIDTIFINIQHIAASELIRKCLFYNVINMIAKIASEVGFALKTREISELSSYESTEMLQQKIKEIIRDLCKNVLAFNEQQTNKAKLKIIEYVHKKYADHNLSLDILAKEFNLSYNYISKIFKDETGQTFLSYITQLRFNLIKKQLVESDTSIKDIIMQAGYLDVANFMRKFKQNEGVTLGQYRQIYRANKGK